MQDEEMALTKLINLATTLVTPKADSNNNPLILKRIFDTMHTDTSFCTPEVFENVQSELAEQGCNDAFLVPYLDIDFWKYMLLPGILRPIPNRMLKDSLISLNIEHN